jgi:hypothetical protein
MLPVMSLELLLVVFKFVRIFSVKLGCTVLCINAIPFFQKKRNVLGQLWTGRNRITYLTEHRY